MQKKVEKSWKDYLLKSGLPLEHVISTILEKHKIHSYGEYSYVRRNEKGEQSEHSIDIHSVFTSTFSWFHFLIECKYSHQSVKWVFSPISKGTKNFNLLEYGLVKFFEELCPCRIDHTKFERFESNLVFCSKGVEIYSKDFNPETIKKGLYQLRFALPNKAVDIVERQLGTRHDEDLQIELLIPMLVTTAPLYIIKHKIDINSFQTADEINSIATKVDSLIVYQEPSINLNEYIEILFKNLRENPLFHIRLKELNVLFNEYTKKDHFLDFDLYDNFRRLPIKILVVNLDALEKIIIKLLSAFKASMKSYDKFAVLKNDWKKHKSFFDTKTWFEKYEQDDSGES